MRNWINLIEGKLNSIQQAMLDRIPETGSIKIKNGGHDGIVMQTEDGSHRVVIAFSPNQIKSVDNHGTFNPSDPRMAH